MAHSAEPAGTRTFRTVFWITVFGIAMAFVESAVVVYLRAIYYPDGFSFPLRPIVDNTLKVEILREIATIFMLFSVAVIAGRSRWERFAYFLYSFAIWDIFYYLWLKALIDWPSTVFEWDILFLIPLPWIGPVIAPLSVSLLMIAAGLLIIHSFHTGRYFQPPPSSYVLALIGTCSILFTFMWDIDAALYQKYPRPYLYELLILGEVLYIAAFVISYRKTAKKQ